MTKKRNKTIADVLRDPSISVLDKKLLFEKWKFNQLPKFYRDEHIQDIQEKIARIIKEAKEQENITAKGGESAK